MRRLLARLTVPACLLGACRGPSKEPGHIAIEDRIPLPGPPPAALALSEFRPRMLADVDSGGRCREDFYWGRAGIGRWCGVVTVRTVGSGRSKSPRTAPVWYGAITRIATATRPD